MPIPLCIPMCLPACTLHSLCLTGWYITKATINKLVAKEWSMLTCWVQQWQPWFPFMFIMIKLGVFLNVNDTWGKTWYSQQWQHSVRLHAHLSRITATVRLCYSIRQLLLSEYTCQWENGITGRSMSYPRYDRWRCTHFNKWQWSHLQLTSLCHQQQQTLPRHSRKMAYKERDEATYLYIPYKVYMIITQTRCTMALLLAVISEETCCRHRPSISGSRPREKNLEPAQNAKSESDLMEHIHARVMRPSIE